MLPRLYRLFYPKGIVVELLKSINPGPEVLAACAAARREGYVLALADYEQRCKLVALLQFVSIVKVQVMHSCCWPFH
ncbi:MAG: hypothetical protein M3Y64_11375 [Gemmatimonadota bacterium]|nr:hypothetical protein [Gemmatimonadota bacterium]